MRKEDAGPFEDNLRPRKRPPAPHEISTSLFGSSSRLSAPGGKCLRASLSNQEWTRRLH
jgi:hypothetical protein